MTGKKVWESWNTSGCLTELCFGSFLLLLLLCPPPQADGPGHGPKATSARNIVSIFYFVFSFQIIR